jgi:hypothetical protein
MKKIFVGIYSMLTEKEIQNYQEIYKKEFGKNISKQEAIEAGQNLVNLFSLLLKIDKRNNPENYTKPKNHS